MTLTNRAKEARDRYGELRHHSSYHDLLRDEEVQAVVITAPHRYHAEMAAEALSSSRHVLVEKPLATDY